MDISIFPPNWVGIITGIAFGASWIWKSGKWFRAKIASTREGAKLGEELVTQLLDRATTPARRADIHAYIQFLCIEMEADHTRNVMLSIASACVVAFVGVLLVVVDHFFVTDSAPWFWRFTIATYIALIISFAMALFSSRQLRSLQIGWHDRAGDVLRERAFKHVAET